MRLIDADALKAELIAHHDFFINAYGGFKNLPANDRSRVDEITACISNVVNSPTIEAEPVVRCKDCKHLVILEKTAIPLCCDGGGLMPLSYNIETWFCPHGEKRCGAKMDLEG